MSKEALQGGRPKTRYQTRHWREYDRGLIARGDLTVWLSPDLAWHAPEGTGRRAHPREWQKPGALRRELDCLLAEASVQHRGPDLKHTVRASGRPAHMPSLVHARVDQVVDRALGP